jgi:hypothetical protein
VQNWEQAKEEKEEVFLLVEGRAPEKALDGPCGGAEKRLQGPATCAPTETQFNALLLS